MVNRDLLNAHKELLAHAYGHAQAYTSVVLLAGYAGFFAIWSFLKQDLNKLQILSSGLLISVSLSAYIIWEVYQGFHRSRSLMGLTKAVSSPENFESLLGEYYRNQRDRDIRLLRVWYTVFGFTVITGFSAVAIIIWAFIDGLYGMYVA